MDVTPVPTVTGERRAEWAKRETPFLLNIPSHNAMKIQPQQNDEAFQAVTGLQRAPQVSEQCVSAFSMLIMVKEDDDLVKKNTNIMYTALQPKLDSGSLVHCIASVSKRSVKYKRFFLPPEEDDDDSDTDDIFIDNFELLSFEDNLSTSFLPFSTSYLLVLMSEIFKLLGVDKDYQWNLEKTPMSICRLNADVPQMLATIIIEQQAADGTRAADVTSLEFQQLLRVASGIDRSCTTEDGWFMKEKDALISQVQKKAFSFRWELYFEPFEDNSAEPSESVPRGVINQLVTDLSDPSKVDSLREECERRAVVTWEEYQNKGRFERLIPESRNFIGDILEDAAWTPEVFNIFVDPLLRIKSRLYLRLDTEHLDSNEPWTVLMSDFSVDGSREAYDEILQASGRECGVSAAQWREIVATVTKPLLVTLRFDSSVIHVGGPKKAWSHLMYDFSHPQVARKSTGGSQTSTKPKSWKRKVSGRELKMLQRDQPAKKQNQQPVVYVTNSRTAAGRGLGIQVLPNFTSLSSQASGSFGLRSPGLTTTSTSSSQSLLIVCFLAGTFRSCGGHSAIEAWEIEAEKQGICIGFIEADSREEALLEMNALGKSVSSTFASAFRQVIVHVITHTTQTPENLRWNGKVVWWNSRDFGSTEPLVSFLSTLMVSVTEHLRSVNCLFTLATCNLDNAIIASPLLSTKLTRVLKDVRSGPLCWTIAASRTPELSEKVAADPVIWLPFMCEWITCIDKSAFDPPQSSLPIFLSLIKINQ